MQNRMKMRIVNPVAAGLLGLGLTALACPSFAHADSEGVLLLGLQRDGRFDAEVRDAIRTRLEQMAVTSAVHGPRLGTEDLKCTAPACLERLGRTHDARWLLGGQIVGSEGTYVINLWLFDRDTQALRQSKAGCNDCEAAALRDRVAYAAGELFSPERIDPTPPLVPPVATEPPLAKPKLPLCPIRYHSFARGLAVGSTAALLVAGLTTGLALTIQNGQNYASDGSSKYHLGPSMGLAYGLSVVPAGALAGAVLWNRSEVGGQNTTQCAERPPTRWTYSRGTWVGATGALVLGGLISTVTLGAMSGRYHYNASQTYSFAGPAAILGGVTALSAVGFGLSLGL